MKDYGQKTCEACGKQLTRSQMKSQNKYCSWTCSFPFTGKVTIKQTEQRNQKFINRFNDKFLDRFVYVSGYTGSDGKVTCRCVKCGELKVIVAGCVRERHVAVCLACKRKAATALKQEIDRVVKEQRSVLKRQQQEAAIRNHPTIARACRWCGVEFVRAYKASLRFYCCEEHRIEAHKDQFRKYRRTVSGKRHKGGVSTAKRMRIWSRDGNTCQLCGKKMRMDKYETIPSGCPHPLAPTVDHIIPTSIAKQLGWAKIQINAETNLQAAHFVCNVRKGNRSMGEQLRLC